MGDHHNTIVTRAVQSGQHSDESTGAVASPLVLSTTFERDADGQYSRGHVYSRQSNPNRSALEKCVSKLEQGCETAAFASGSVAAMSLFQALRPGDHLLVPTEIYFGIRQILTEVFIPWGLAVSFVDMTDPGQVRAAGRPETKLIFIETPSNPQLGITDISAIAAIARERQAYLVCDNTMATPMLQHPLQLGADMVLHSTTKYFGGHSDSMAGTITTREMTPFFEKIRFLQQVGGAIASPFDCWLCLRGIQTLPWRIKAHCENAMMVARFLSEHPRVEEVIYPGLATHRDHQVAARQMSAFGAMISILLRGDEQTAIAVAAAVQLFTRATSFGGTHSFIEHRASVEHEGTKTPRNLLRLSIGLESAEDLIADLDQALSLATAGQAK